MVRTVFLRLLPGILGLGFLFVAQSASAIIITCSATGPGNLGCQTDPKFPNTWFIPATNENEPDAEQTMTLTFGNNPAQSTITNTGVFNILDPDHTTISDQVRLVNTPNGGQLIFTSDPFVPMAGGQTFGTEGANGANGVIAPLPVHFTSGDVITTFIGSDDEAFFNPIGVGGNQDLSDSITLTPEPSTIAYAFPALVPFAGVYLKRRKRRQQTITVRCG